MRRIAWQKWKRRPFRTSLRRGARRARGCLGVPSSLLLLSSRSLSASFPVRQLLPLSCYSYIFHIDRFRYLVHLRVRVVASHLPEAAVQIRPQLVGLLQLDAGPRQGHRCCHCRIACPQAHQEHLESHSYSYCLFAKSLQADILMSGLRKIFQSFALFVPAACFVLLSFVDVGATGAIVLFVRSRPSLRCSLSSSHLGVFKCIAIGISSCQVGGGEGTGYDMSVKYAGFMMAYAPLSLVFQRDADALFYSRITNTAGTVPGIIGVYLTGYMLEATGVWYIFFYVSSIYPSSHILPHSVGGLCRFWRPSSRLLEASSLMSSRARTPSTSTTKTRPAAATRRTTIPNR